MTSAPGLALDSTTASLKEQSSSQTPSKGSKRVVVLKTSARAVEERASRESRGRAAARAIRCMNPPVRKMDPEIQGDARPGCKRSARAWKAILREKRPVGRTVEG